MVWGMMWRLLNLLDGDGAVEGGGTGAEVGEVGVVDACLELVGVDAAANEEFLDAVDAAVAQACVDGLVAGVIVGPAGELVAGVRVVLHDLGNGGENALLTLAEGGDVDGIVNGGEAVAVGGYLCGGALAAVVELVLQVGNLVLGGAELGSEGVTLGISVLPGGADGGDGAVPLALLEVVIPAVRFTR